MLLSLALVLQDNVI